MSQWQKCKRRLRRLSPSPQGSRVKTLISLASKARDRFLSSMGGRSSLTLDIWSRASLVVSETLVRRALWPGDLHRAVCLRIALVTLQKTLSHSGSTTSLLVSKEVENDLTATNYLLLHRSRRLSRFEGSLPESTRRHVPSCENQNWSSFHASSCDLLSRTFLIRASPRILSVCQWSLAKLPRGI